MNVLGYKNLAVAVIEKSYKDIKSKDKRNHREAIAFFKSETFDLFISALDLDRDVILEKVNKESGGLLS